LLIFLFSCTKDKKTEEAARKMQQFVIDIADFARGLDPDFIIIPQNGIELAYLDTDPAQGLNTEYLAAVNGFGVEELFYNGDLALDEERLDMLRELVDYKKIMVSDYVSDDQNLADDINRNLDEGFICFPRSNENYYYNHLPEVIINESSSDITGLDQAENYLYLISTDLFASKQEMLDGLKSTNYDVLLIDLFFEDIALTTDEIVQLKTKANGGERLVISYLNIGSAENWRYYWQDDWKFHHPDWIKKKYEGYEDEYWVEFWNNEWQDIIFGNEGSYLKKIIDAGFDGVYLDNVEGYYFLYND
jgi:cysteinyl-tRNA synthetase